MTSREAARMLNCLDGDVHVRIFLERAPADPYQISISAQPSKHLLTSGLNNLCPILRCTDCSKGIETGVPIVVHHKPDPERRGLGLTFHRYETKNFAAS